MAGKSNLLPGSSRPRLRRRRVGFTLIEILVVVFIIALVTGLGAPSFSRAMKEQRMRSSARTIITAHKYARNMAVLRQKPMAIVFNFPAGQLEVVSVADRSGLADRGGFLEERIPQRRSPTKRSATTESTPEAEEQAPPAKLDTVELRRMENEVKMVKLESEGDIYETEDVYWVNYYASGMSDGFKLTLENEAGSQLVIVADPISGGASLEEDD